MSAGNKGGPRRVEEFLILAAGPQKAAAIILVDIDTGEGSGEAVLFLGGFGIPARLSRHGHEIDLVPADPMVLAPLDGQESVTVVETDEGRVLRSYRADLF